jgi:putative ABC transport system substrate-binding protein
MRRRDLLAFIAGATTVQSVVGAAQQKAMPVVGYLNSGSPPENLDDLSHNPVHQGLGQIGYVEGQNMAAEYRWAEEHYDRLPALAADLVSRKVDIIVALAGTPPALAAKGATSTIPIVFYGVADPVGMGLVASLARPGGNVTGFSNLLEDVTPKLLELISELVPQAALIALLMNPNNPGSGPVTRDLQESARAKGIELAVLNAGTEGEITAAFDYLDQLRAGALVLGPDGFLIRRRDQIVALASHHAVPAIYPFRDFPAHGGLISYGPDLATAFRQVGIYAGRILKGEKPADMPVQQPIKFELVINLNTTKALGLAVPQSILARADEVIE